MALIFVILTLLFGSTALVAAEQTNYPFPVEGVVRSYSGSFGEIRSNHFHSGLDIRTDGVEGKRVVAVDDGYVSRISLSPEGFGLALYIAHPNGTTTTYAHLQRLNDTLQTFLVNERYRQKSHALNIYPEADQLCVKRGELIAYSGNSGSSNGPHLHFEVRSSRDQRPLNPVKRGVITIEDKIAPTLHTLYYVEVDDSQGVERHSIQRHPLKRDSKGVYRSTRSSSVWVGRKGFFILESSERKSGSSAVMGLYSVEGLRDGEPFYRFQQDGFTFDKTRYCNGVSYYPYQEGSSREFYQLRRQPLVPAELFDHLSPEEGMVGLKAGESSQIEIIATDESGNSSRVVVQIHGKDNRDIFRTSLPKPKHIIRYDRETTISEGDLTVTIPKGASYRNIPFVAREVVGKQESLPEGVESLSRRYSILQKGVALQRPMTISIKTPQREGLVMMHRNLKGALSPIKCSFEGRRATATAYSPGEYFVGCDNVDPTITTKVVSGDDLTGKEVISFTIQDNFSGVAKYSATLDGEWIALDRQKGRLSHTFRWPADGKEHKIVVEIEDTCGNRASIERAFRR